MALVMSCLMFHSCSNSEHKFESTGKVLVDKDSVSYSISDSLITDQQTLIREIDLLSYAAKLKVKHPLTFKATYFKTRKFPKNEEDNLLNQPFSYRGEKYFIEYELDGDSSKFSSIDKVSTLMFQSSNSFGVPGELVIECYYSGANIVHQEILDLD